MGTVISRPFDATPPSAAAPTSPPSATGNRNTRSIGGRDAVAGTKPLEHVVGRVDPRRAEIAGGQHVIRGQIARRGVDRDRLVGGRREAEPAEHRQGDEQQADDEPGVDLRQPERERRVRPAP